jgi:hypothetical protein
MMLFLSATGDEAAGIHSLKIAPSFCGIWYPEVVIGPSIIIVYLSVACASPVAAVRSSSIILFLTMTWKGERWSGQKTS